VFTEFAAAAAGFDAHHFTPASRRNGREANGIRTRRRPQANRCVEDVFRRPEFARGLRADGPLENRGPCCDRDALEDRARRQWVVRTLVTQSRMASLMASFSVRLPEIDATTCVPSRRIRATLSACAPCLPYPCRQTHLRARVRWHGGASDSVPTCAVSAMHAAACPFHGVQALARWRC